MQSDVEAVIAEANANRRTYEAFCRSLTSEELNSPIPGNPWRVRDYISHLASIDLFVADWFEHQAEGTPWRPRGEDGGPFNIDTWNEARIQERRHASLDELFAEAAELRTRLWTAVHRFSPEVLAAEFNFRGTDISLLRYLQLWVAHDPAHTLDMLKGLPETRRDAAMKEWLAKYRLA